MARDELPYALAAAEEGRPAVGGQWRVSYLRPNPGQLTPAVASALSVVDKILTRGRLTTLSPWLESALSKDSPSGVSQPVSASHGLPGPALDSEPERWFWNYSLPAMLGSGYLAWTTPQLEIASLTGESEHLGKDQRVDFLISHPGLDRPIVVEIDGGQHTPGAVLDETRVAHLTANGYRVVRIPVEETRAGSGQKLTELTGLLSPLEPFESFKDRLERPTRRAGQMQLCLLQAIYAALINPDQPTVTVWTDLVDSGALSVRHFDSILRDFTDLIHGVGEMYGVAPLPEFIAAHDSERADLRLSFGGRVADGTTMYLEEVHLPVQIQWVPRAVRPTLPVNVTEEGARSFLERIFGETSFLEGQLEIVSRALRGKDTVGLLPTGGGKSIAFQLAALLLPGRTIVVAPILSLIRDQEQNLRARGVDRTQGISSDVANRGERDAAYEVLVRGDAFFYYIAPERFQMREFRDKLRGMAAAFPVNMIVVDEAHCVSEWGHDFRTSYLRLGQTARETCASGVWTPPIIALTGTASRQVLRDLQRELTITEFDALVTPKSFDRPELTFEVLHENSDAKEFVLRTYLSSTLPSYFGLSPEEFYGDTGDHRHCGVVFCPNVNGPFGVVDVAGVVRRAGIDGGYYSSGRPKDFYGDELSWKTHKIGVERAFKENNLAVLAATKAYGMGIDKQNIRFTVHYGLPPSLESFYQEAGRAGRSRDPGQKRAVCALIVSDDRPAKNQTLLAPTVTVEEVAQFVKGTSFDDNDDITRMLFFHVRAFKGSETESKAIKGALTRLSPVGQQAKRQIGFGVDRALTEKALHRLVVLGIVSDYTVDYSAQAFAVVLGDTDRQSVIEAYTSYVSSYQRGRAEAERRKADAIGTEWEEFLTGIAELYVRFVYDVIERGRRRAIAEMLAASRASTGEELRERILDYFQQTEYSEAVESILSSEDVGLSVIASVLAEIIGPEDAATLRGTVGRSLETYPDHPSLLLLRSVAEALARNPDEDIVDGNFRAFLKNAAEGYAMADDSIAQAVASALRAVSRKDSKQALRLEQRYLARKPGREQMHVLVREAGLKSATLTPWVMLTQIASSVNRAHRSSTEQV